MVVSVRNTVFLDVRNTVFLDVTPPPSVCFLESMFITPVPSQTPVFLTASHCLICRSMSFPLIPIRTLSSLCSLLFCFQNGGSNFLWNVDNFYQVTWCHVPDDSILHYFSTFSVDSKNCEKWPCLSVHRVHRHGTTVLTLDEFSWNLIFEYFFKIQGLEKK